MIFKDMIKNNGNKRINIYSVSFSLGDLPNVGWKALDVEANNIKSDEASKAQLSSMAFNDPDQQSPN